MRSQFLLAVGGTLLLVLSACASSEPTPNSSPQSASEHAGHTMPSSSADDLPFDATFIDGMVEHHEGAVSMAETVLVQSERAELREMAEAVIAAQTAEITQMQAWRAAWYPDLPASGGMEMDMGDMSISTDESIPFDQRFLVAMISHHEGALHMAEAALENAEHEEIRTLANEIITTQSIEIEQMRTWLDEWFGVTE